MHHWLKEDWRPCNKSINRSIN